MVLILAFVSQFIQEQLYYLVLAAWIVLVMTRSRLSFRALVGQIPPGYNWWPIVLMGIAGVAYAVGAITVVMLPLAQLNSELVAELLSMSLPGSPLSLFIELVILAPLMEETIFRGLLFSRLTEKWGMTKAMIVSSLAFGLLHMDPIGSFVFGIVTCVLYVRTRTLLVPMALHALHNLIVWAFMFSGLDGEIAFTSPEVRGQWAYEGLLAMMLASPIVFVLLARWWPSRDAPIPYLPNKGDSTIAS